MASTNDARSRGCTGLRRRENTEAAFDHGQRAFALQGIASAIDLAWQTGCSDEQIALAIGEALDARGAWLRETVLDPEVVNRIAAGLSPRPESGTEEDD